MVGKKRSVKNTKTPTPELLLEQISNLPPKYSSYAAFLYLFGTRCREPLGLRNGKDRNKWDVTPMKVDDLVLNDGVLYVRNMPVFKREGRPTISKYVMLNDRERPFITLLLAYTGTLNRGEYPWTFSRYAAWSHVKKSTGLYPHALRSMRATEDATTYDLDLQALMKKFGWTQVRMPMHYVNMKNTDIIAKMKRYGNNGVYVKEETVQSVQAETGVAAVEQRVP